MMQNDNEDTVPENLKIYAERTDTGFKLKLKYPFESSGVKYNELNLRRMKVLDKKAAALIKDPGDREIRMFTNLADIPEDALLEVDEFDYGNLQDGYTYFLVLS